MKKIRHYTGNALDFHNKVLSSKKNSPQDPDYKVRMVGRLNITSAQFDEYDRRFLEDRLEGMTIIQQTDDEKKDFKRLYNYNSVPFQQLNDDLSHDENDHIYPFCPICDIGEPHTFDHILPQEEFPVLCDHPKNLMRCCTVCNGYKSSIWLENGQRKYLDLYIDDLPLIQMLFVRLGINNGTMTYEYYVSDIKHPDANLYRMYKNTFEKFHLDERYRSQSEDIVSALISIFKPIICQFQPSEEQLKDIVRKNVLDEQGRYGVNYWKAILKLAICDDINIFNWVLSKSS